ncbi:MAG: flagellar hook-associated protein 1 [Gammaproteobacteria bacterium]|nr:flagellar hook-associated protein 1 [Gammaproteobacteria bacterium]
MSDIFGISVSALQAFQSAIAVTSNNVANASTPGYDRQSVILNEALPQVNGSATVGNGVAIGGVTRAYSQAAAAQLNTSQSNLGQLTSLQNYTSQIDNLFGTTAGGLSTALTGFYSAWSTVANNPTSTASRQSLLSQAQGVASSLQSTTSQLNALNTDVNNRITADVQQINSIATSISTLNKQIALSTANDGGQAPNSLLDQRDQLLSSLSSLVGVTTTTSDNGALNVFVGTGQALVLGDQTNQLTTVPNQYNASQLDVSSASANGNVLNNSLTAGDLGGLIAARTQAIDPALSQLGQAATAFSSAVNSQQAAGLDLSGAAGASIFSTAPPTVVPSSKNTGTGVAAVGVINVGALTSDSYILTYKGGAYSLTKVSDGSNVPLTGTGTAADPFKANGISIALTGTPASGDTFLVQPTAGAASGLKVVLTDPSKIAAAGAVSTSAANTNTGNATISAGAVAAPATLNLTATNIVFTSPTTYTVNGTTATYVNGGNIDANGWEVQISGTPAAGDTFTVGKNTGTGDNRNALASAAQQTLGVLNGGTTSITGAVSAMITGIGSQAAQINTAQAAQTAVNTQAANSVKSISGVNLDEEAASLVQWQQAYQAAAQALTIGRSLFTTLLSSVNGTFV